MAILEAYFDESERSDGTSCVAGYVFTPAQAERFSGAWRRTMGTYWPFHMSEFVHGRDKGNRRETRFEGLSQDERDGLLRQIVSLINKRIALSISVSCNVNDVNQATPILAEARSWVFERRPVFDNAYSLCCYVCMALPSRWLQRHRFDDRVVYVFESGNRFQAVTDHLLRTVTFHPSLRQTLHYQSHAFVSKADSAPLQAADLFAWELTKFLDETVTQRIRPPRRSLKALVAPDPQRYEGVVLGLRNLEKYFRALAPIFSRQPGESVVRQLLRRELSDGQRP